MHAWVRTCIEKRDISHVLVFSAAMAQYVSDPARPFERRVIDFVDVDSDKWQQYAMQKRWPMDWLYRREGDLLLQFEREVAHMFDACLFVSSTEAAMFRELAPESAHKVGFYNNGVNTGYFAPDDALTNPYSTEEKALVFTGAMDYWPNIDAVTWFAREVLPAILAHEPSLKFYIVGSSPASAVTQLGRLPGVKVTGRVEDVRPYLQYALAAVAPMRIARGVQNKVLEAMAMAKPVIVSSKGLEGIDACHSEHLLVADCAREYVTCLQQVMAGEHLHMGKLARQLISSRFNWDQNLPEVVYLLSGESMPVIGEKAFA
jgi:sugar transferase (PEP-CTERM/EpsH1 system associated)